jgi:hypothetical protein
VEEMAERKAEIDQLEREKNTIVEGVFAQFCHRELGMNLIREYEQRVLQYKLKIDDAEKALLHVAQKAADEQGKDAKAAEQRIAYVSILTYKFSNFASTKKFQINIYIIMQTVSLL